MEYRAYRGLQQVGAIQVADEEVLRNQPPRVVEDQNGTIWTRVMVDGVYIYIATKKVAGHLTVTH